ncbi:hypothetical protein [Pasteuria penetrans]|uniref:hypothetical protein n=1 Tax=Pasteuria penetrans TaxID=86005 RepID=UPI000F925B34|nr:hypothetical protein [Pasteuria penetrans]
MKIRAKFIRRSLLLSLGGLFSAMSLLPSSQATSIRRPSVAHDTASGDWGWHRNTENVSVPRDADYGKSIGSIPQGAIIEPSPTYPNPPTNEWREVPSIFDPNYVPNSRPAKGKGSVSVKIVDKLNKGAAYRAPSRKSYSDNSWIMDESVDPSEKPLPKIDFGTPGLQDYGVDWGPNRKKDDAGKSWPADYGVHFGFRRK